MSLLFDKKGIHYDSDKSNQLEELLQNKILNNDELNRSRKLINLITKSQISKYNLKIENKIKLPKEASKKENNSYFWVKLKLIIQSYMEYQEILLKNKLCIS